jgi:predicted AlkP superfamily phosphohydrolase/phosphomutase
MPENTKSLSSGALTPAEFLSVVDRVMDETEAALDHELARFPGGLLFVYLSSIDQTSHVFFRSLDPDAPEADRAHADVIPSLYRRVDTWIPRVLEKVSEHTELLIMSDHGFAPYRTKVHLNTFLAQRGYLSVLPESERGRGSLGHIDWSQTQAYAYGLNQLFVNLAGRERHGVVPASEREVLLRRLERDLLGLRDPSSGATAITRVDRLPPGRFADREPDLIVGYRRGYRISDEAALGAVGEEVFEDNRDQWSGDHCMDPDAVPGLVVSGSALYVGGGRPHLRDLASTILHYFGIRPPDELDGRALLGKR